MYDDHSSPLSLCSILSKMDSYLKHFGSGNTYTNFFN